jgi:hypothetical protein
MVRVADILMPLIGITYLAALFLMEIVHEKAGYE